LREVGLLHADGFNLIFEVVTIADSAILGAGSVVVDGVDRVVQKLGNLAAVVDSKSDEGKDADGGVELIVLGELNLGLRLQQGIKIVHKVGEQVQECRPRLSQNIAMAMVLLSDC